MRAVAAASLLLLSACAVPGGTPETVSRGQPEPLPPAASFGAPDPIPPARSNTEMARDFLDLSFNLESGQTLPVMTRFEGPLTYRITGQPDPALKYELVRLFARMNREAGLKITPAAANQPAAITVEGVRAAALHAAVPDAACFVLPARTDWAAFTANRDAEAFRWTTLTTRTAITAFVPVGAGTQDMRDCLHEEIAQGLGPLNDLYRLGDSVFNDDNMQSVLTGFDMLMLRVTYDRELHSGMSRTEVAAALPEILDRLNPAGADLPTRPYQPSTRSWRTAIERALGDGSASSRRAAAREALSIAEDEGWDDTRTALCWYTLGRIDMDGDPETALDELLNASRLYAARPETRLQTAQVGLQVAAIALAAGEWDVVETLTARYTPVAKRGEDASLLSDLLMVRADALRAAGKPWEATRRNGLAWARYAYGSASQVRDRAAQIDRLLPAPGQEGSS